MTHHDIIGQKYPEDLAMPVKSTYSAMNERMIIVASLEEIMG